MERERFLKIKGLLRRLGRRRTSIKQRYSDATIVEVYCWAVLHDRPTVWASRPEHWPGGLRRGSLPSQSALSRRLRTDGVERLFQRLEEAILRNGRIAPLVSIIDGKPLPVANHSHDRQAGYGRAVGGKAKGYKLHALLDAHGTVWGWRVAPMHKDERTMAHRLLRKLPSQGYLLADANYDSNKLFADAAAQGVQLIVPRRGTAPSIPRGSEVGICWRTPYPASAPRSTTPGALLNASSGASHAPPAACRTSLHGSEPIDASDAGFKPNSSSTNFAPTTTIRRFVVHNPRALRAMNLKHHECH